MLYPPRIPSRSLCDPWIQQNKRNNWFHMTVHFRTICTEKLCYNDQCLPVVHFTSKNSHAPLIGRLLFLILPNTYYNVRSDFTGLHSELPVEDFQTHFIIMCAHYDIVVSCSCAFVSRYWGGSKYITKPHPYSSVCTDRLFFTYHTLTFE